MIDNDIRRTIDGNPTAHLATLMPDGSPHSVPVWVGMRGDRIAIQTGPGSSGPGGRVAGRRRRLAGR
jgi:hypothetical protein